MAIKKPYQRPLQNSFDDLTDLETIDYNNDASISDSNDIATGSKKGAQIAGQKKIIKKYRNLGKKKAPETTFNDIADAETIDYNNDANISDLNKTPIKKPQVHK